MAALDAPTAAPSKSASASTGLKSPFVPRQPEITTFAYVSSGLQPLTAGLESVIVTSFPFSEIRTSTFSKAGALDPTSASIAEG